MYDRIEIEPDLKELALKIYNYDKELLNKRRKTLWVVFEPLWMLKRRWISLDNYIYFPQRLIAGAFVSIFAIVFIHYFIIVYSIAGY